MFDFLGDTFEGIGNFGADTDKFMKREMPFDSGWGAPAALAAAIAASIYAPQTIPAMLEVGGEAGAAEGASAVGGESMLSSIGGSGGSFGGDLFQLGGSTGGSMGGGGGFMDSFGSLFGSNDGGFGIGKGANYTDFANTSGGSFGNLNPMASPSGGEYGLNFGSPSSIASSNQAMGLNDLSPSGGSGGTDFLKELMKNQQQTAQKNQGIFDNYQPTQVTRQSAFLPTPGMVQVQDKQTDLAALIKALRG